MAFWVCPAVRHRECETKKAVTGIGAVPDTWTCAPSGRRKLQRQRLFKTRGWTLWPVFGGAPIDTQIKGAEKKGAQNRPSVRREELWDHMRRRTLKNWAAPENWRCLTKADEMLNMGLPAWYGKRFWVMRPKDRITVLFFGYHVKKKIMQLTKKFQKRRDIDSIGRPEFKRLTWSTNGTVWVDKNKKKRMR